jgi:D-glycero-D-manno-heptose 1,7-bisphosphate phosphatase
MKKQRVLFLDLDGTIRYSKSGEFIESPEDVVVFPDVKAKLREYRDQGYLIFGISNQGGVAFGFKTIDEIMKIEAETLRQLEGEGQNWHRLFDNIEYCFSHPEGTIEPWNCKSLLRKPYVGMLVRIEEWCRQRGYYIDYDQSLFVGDREEDQECARRAGIAFQWADDFFGRKL